MSEPDWAGRLPVYRSHKLVHAAPIAAFEGVAPGTDGDEVLRLALNAHNWVKVVVPAAIFARGRPKVGDYLVVYDGDGYVSWSPRGAFETGYTEATA